MTGCCHQWRSNRTVILAADRRSAPGCVAANHQHRPDGGDLAVLSLMLGLPRARQLSSMPPRRTNRSAGLGQRHCMFQ
jgi:hypothetical protein